MGGRRKLTMMISVGQATAVEPLQSTSFERPVSRGTWEATEAGTWIC